MNDGHVAPAAAHTCAMPARPESVVFRPLQALQHGRKPHILINCPENSGCTTFAQVLCVLLDASACRIDTAEDSPRWEVSENVTFVHKSVINGYSHCRTEDCFSRASLNGMAAQLAPPRSFTHHILLFRDPVQNYISLARKPWCDNCGGFGAKWQATELSFQAHYMWRLSPFYDAVVFEDWMRPQSLSTLLTKLGLREHLIDMSSTANDPVATYHREMRRLYSAREVAHFGEGFTHWTRRAKQLGFDTTGMQTGNFHPEKALASEAYPEVCAAVTAAARYTPHLFAHYHPERSSRLVGVDRESSHNETAALGCSPLTLVSMLKARGSCQGALSASGVALLRRGHRNQELGATFLHARKCDQSCLCCS